MITTFIGALFSAFCYWRAAQTEVADPNGSRSWMILARNAFIIHTAAVIAVFFALYYIITNHLFEYNYAWQHSSRDLPSKYLLSCFWEGQEGSFLLWAFWHGMLGLVVMATAGKMESRVMTIIALVQVCLATMVLGFYISPDIKIGSTPFALLRHNMAGAPIFAQPNYMQFIQDGNGLNVLLQNYWMVIHPPILFLGFAATLIPFAYAIAALWKGDYDSWLKPTRNWLLFGGVVLGVGIMMGGKWAYESLNFGGYWAWDPVENASLVPWLTLIAGLHTLIIFKATGRSAIITFILLIATYALIWYSTFLTRTGVLGDTSVHAFTGEGKSLYWHLLVVIALLLILSITLLVRRRKGIPRIKTEEGVDTREFWMLIGSIVLLLSAVQISIMTSLPVWSPLYEAIVGKKPAPPVDIVQSYNNVQVWVAIIITLLSGAVLYLKFKKTDTKTALRRLGWVALAALAVSLAIGFAQKIDAWQYALLLFATCFAIIANLFYVIRIQKAKIKKTGAGIAHLGFAMTMLGILLSSFNKEVISINTLGVVLNMGKPTQAENVRESRENVILFRNTPVVLGDYLVTYLGDSAVQGRKDQRSYYKVLYERRDSATNKVLESFVLYPDAFINPKGEQGLSANPAAKHYLHKDIFTYVTSVIDPAKRTDTTSYRNHVVKQGDTLFINNGYLLFKGFSTEINDPRYQRAAGDVAVTAKLDVYAMGGAPRTMQPIYYIRDQYEQQIEDTLKDMGIYARLVKVLPDQNAAEIAIKETDPKDDYIVMKALVFPYINVLWIGIIVMAIGFLISLWNRITKKETEKKVRAV